MVKLGEYFNDTTRYISNSSKEIILNTANEAIEDSVKNLDKKAQDSLERLTFEVANNVAEFLYQRDEDITFLSSLNINQKTLESFYNSKNREIIVHEDYEYNDTTNNWQSTNPPKELVREKTNANLKDNDKEFNYIDPIFFEKKLIPIYKEVSFFDLNGKEKYKVSSIDKDLKDLSKKDNTYLKAENFFPEIINLEKNDIYVSEVIGEYVGTKVIGTFTKDKAKKANIEFEPENYAYAGKENPVGKKFEGIVRFVKPVYENENKIGYVSILLDHEHIMQFTDTLNPTSKNPVNNIIDASEGNYAFMWDFEGKNISHIRDYFIYGYDSSTGNGVMPWLSKDVADKFYNSNKDINTFLKSYPTFEEQSLSKKPNIKQLKDYGEIPLDCRYLNFAPQCDGWMQLTQNGGFGSFVIFWSGVWKLSTAATIPYYTGQYADSKRGFGFVTIGANVDEFHAAANKTRNNIKNILKTQNEFMNDLIEENKNQVNTFIQKNISELTTITVVITLIVILIAIWLSNYISSKISNLLIATKKFGKNDFKFRTKITSKDEIGELEKSFNEMANKIENLILSQKDTNDNLQKIVSEKTEELRKINSNLQEKIKNEVDNSRQKDALLTQNSKMAAMGEMISMIIHQWKQPLNVIAMISSEQNLLKQLGKYSLDDLESDNSKIKKQIILMEKTMNDFRNFFEKSPKEVYNVKEMIDMSIDLVESIYKAQGIAINLNINEELYESKTLGYKNEIIQVLINILNNARDEILTKKTKYSKIDISLVDNKEYLDIVIQDYSGGVPENIIDNIFEPYFTTKPSSKGTGLGLYMTKSILDKVNGNIKVENVKSNIKDEILVGAKFTISIIKED